jgi:ribose-phosphate pyrophosphokinase
VKRGSHFLLRFKATNISFCLIVSKIYDFLQQINRISAYLFQGRVPLAGYTTAVIPYFGYARQDRKDKPQVPISAKLIANMLEAAGANRIMTMDLHADQLQGFFDIPVDHLKSEPIFVQYLKEKVNVENVLFASPNLGGVKRARNFARILEVDFITCSKYGKKANEIAEMNVIGDVEWRDVILFDY